MFFCGDIFLYYILTQNFTDMYNLTDPTYCDKLLILTSKIIGKYLFSVHFLWLQETY